MSRSRQSLLDTVLPVWRRLPARIRIPARRIFRRHGGLPQYPDDEHPERTAVLAQAPEGLVIEVGCGPRKSASGFIGVDLTPGGIPGTTGNAAGRPSEADVAGDGSMLPFRTGSADSIIARHNLEHYVDLVGTLQEWWRVTAPGGRLIAIVPDEDRYEGRTLDLDPTHYHSFNEAFSSRLLTLLGWTVLVVEPCIEGWSLLLVAEKPS